MRDLRVLAVCALAAVGLLTACGSNQNPSTVQPSPVVVSGAAAADGSTLKVTAPTAVSPIGGVQLETRLPALVINNSTIKYASDIPLTYRFRVLNEANQVFEEGTVQAGTGGRTTYTMTTKLAINKRHTWTARAEYQGAAGPWSATAEFMSPKQLEAYIKGNELYDPLTTGVPSPLIHSHGGVEFFAGLGVKLLNRTAFVQWILPTITDGEFSFEATGVRNSSEEWKTKILSMEDWGAGNTTDNPYRVTVDKRSEWLGQGSLVRFTMRSRGVDAGEPKGVPQSWNKNTVYGWRFTWGGGTAHVYVYEGGFDGPVKVHLSTTYKAPYAPLNHCIRLGSPFGRNEPESLPDVVIRHVWASPNPRPADLGKQ